jgi:GT2 family glycosyltransferase
VIQTHAKTAVVILNWNGKSFLERFLPGVIKFSNLNNTEIYVADNGSVDNSVEFLKANFPDVHLICFDKNYGFTSGYNKALEHIDADYFVLLNSDVEVTENWLIPIIEMMENDQSIAVAMPKILSFENKYKFEYAGASGGYIDKFGYPFCRGRILNSMEADDGQYNSVQDIFWASGAAMFVRADLFKEFKGFDEDFFAHMEEIDLCWRMKNTGYRIVVNPESVVYHVGGGTLPNNSPKKIFLNYRNNLTLLLKNLPKQKIVPILFSRLILDGFSGTIYLVTLKLSFFFAVIKAHLSFYVNFRKILKKRCQNIKPNHKEIYNKSIVLDFFFRRKRKFSLLNFENIKK